MIKPSKKPLDEYKNFKKKSKKKAKRFLDNDSLEQ